MVPKIVIASKADAGLLLSAERVKFKCLLSIGEPRSTTPLGFDRFPKHRKLRLEFHDVDPGFLGADLRAGSYEWGAATPEQVSRLARWCRLVDGPTLIHCHAGISRSSASAIVLAATKLGPGKELEAVQLIERSKADIWPNRHVIRLADRALGRDGALLAAVEAVFVNGSMGARLGLRAWA